MSAVLAVVVAGAIGQAAPTNGMREADVRRDALEHARVVVRPGEVVENATILMRDGFIEAVGTAVEIPAGTTRHDAHGWTVYAGFIDAFVPLASEVAARQTAHEAGAHWNHNVVPQLSVDQLPLPDGESRKALRAVGFTLIAAYPDWGVLRGGGEVLLLSGDEADIRTLHRSAGQAASLDHPREDDESEAYPTSTVGAIALLRQTMLDAAWMARAKELWRDSPADNQAPIGSAALDSLAAAAAGQELVVFQVRSEGDALRVDSIAEELGLRSAVVSSGTEFRRLGELTTAAPNLIVPLKFPDAPDVSDPRSAEQRTLRELETWALAPHNGRLLAERGLKFSLTTAGLKAPGEFPAAARKALEAGLPIEDMLAALTTTPAKLLGVDDIAGTVEKGKLANLVVVDGELFGEDSITREVWIAGRRLEVQPLPRMIFARALVGTLQSGGPLRLRIDAEKNEVSVLREGDAKPLRGRDVRVDEDRITFVLPKAAGLGAGDATCILTRNGEGARLEAHSIDGTSQTIALALEPVAEGASAPAATAPVPEPAATVAFDLRSVPLTMPFGDFGLESEPQMEDLVIRNATIWPSAGAGVLQSADLLVIDGKIAAVGPELRAPPQARVIDGTGKHITAGLIDCHSHTGLDGGVNEGGQSCTAEVRMRDALDPDDINWYRGLAGGLTAANQLHGSANPIGGQNSVVKLRWGSPAADFGVPDAKPGIKFALGENVVRTKSRYPSSRMGVEAFLRDEFRAAGEYDAARLRWETLPPGQRQRTIEPRRDLELETLAQILRQERIIHCHSYRQDEIVMLLRLAESLGFRIGTLQHILEGYKVADTIAAHGAGASSFSDWWAYKVEVMDAIPANGSIMHDAGVLVSFNSDSDELARHMNTEAAKAVRYGATSEPEALNFVTINPAKQIGIGQRTGSLEVGKDADFVIWSGHPLSSFSRCEQTWIDGACRFSLEEDQRLRSRDSALRQSLIAYALAEKDRERKDAKRKSDSGDGDHPAEDARPSLLSRMLSNRDDWALEMWRRGIDPTQHSCGQCGESGGGR